ncbi:MAG: zf-TFIIB domain-containing protein [Deltaproteobacteria bacterium]|nr:zf-TFIIB domain-containing protein [Deltaproteobacteria bacterium]
MTTDGGAATCAACGAALPAMFPGATVTCRCGCRASAPAVSVAPSSSSSSSAPSGVGPYRELAASFAPSAPTVCPYCSNEVPSLVRLCPHCDVRLDGVRCQQCYSLQAPGAFACSRCARPLELEPLLDATDAPCPRCRAADASGSGAGRGSALEAVAGHDSRLHECPRCGGMFVPVAALAEILQRAELGGALRGPEAAGAGRASRVLEEVRYLSCPLCHVSMNRVNFGRLSGVIVDVCKVHGTWFDAGELTRLIAFAAAGGLERARLREAERADSDKRAAKAAAIDSHSVVLSLDLRRDLDTKTDALRDLLDLLLGL